MEAITEGVNNINISDSYKKNRIQVSNTKKPLFFYVNLAKVLTHFPFDINLVNIFSYSDMFNFVAQTVDFV